MSRRVAIAIFILLILLIVIALSVTYYAISNPTIKGNSIDFSSPLREENLSTENLEKSWISELANRDSSKSLLPANEISIKLNLSNSIDKIFKYRVIVDRADEYQFALLKGFLDRNEFNYSHFKRDKSVKIAILVDRDDSFETLINELDNYSLNYTIER